MVNSSFSTGGRMFTVPGFTRSGLSFSSLATLEELSEGFEAGSIFFFTDPFLFNGSSTTGFATVVSRLPLFLSANFTWTWQMPTCRETHDMMLQICPPGPYIACAGLFPPGRHRLRLGLGRWWGADLGWLDRL
jgi:hypothetical protein